MSEASRAGSAAHDDDADAAFDAFVRGEAVEEQQAGQVDGADDLMEARAGGDEDAGPSDPSREHRAVALQEDIVPDSRGGALRGGAEEDVFAGAAVGAWRDDGDRDMRDGEDAGLEEEAAARAAGPGERANEEQRGAMGEADAVDEVPQGHQADDDEDDMVIPQAMLDAINRAPPPAPAARGHSPPRPPPPPWQLFDGFRRIHDDLPEPAPERLEAAQRDIPEAFPRNMTIEQAMAFGRAWRPRPMPREVDMQGRHPQDPGPANARRDGGRAGAVQGRAANRPIDIDDADEPGAEFQRPGAAPAEEAAAPNPAPAAALADEYRAGPPPPAQPLEPAAGVPARRRRRLVLDSDSDDEPEIVQQRMAPRPDRDQNAAPVIDLDEDDDPLAPLQPHIVDVDDENHPEPVWRRARADLARRQVQRDEAMALAIQRRQEAEQRVRAAQGQAEERARQRDQGARFDLVRLFGADGEAELNRLYHDFHERMGQGPGPEAEEAAVAPWRDGRIPAALQPGAEPLQLRVPQRAGGLGVGHLQGVLGRNRQRFEDIFERMAAQAGPWQEVNHEAAWAGIELQPTPLNQARPGFTLSFDLEAIEADKTVIGIDVDSVPKPPKMHLVCARCSALFKVSQGQQSLDDRLHSLKCGHVVDERCLHALSIPPPDPIKSSGAEVIGGSAKDAAPPPPPITPPAAAGPSSRTTRSQARKNSADLPANKRRAASPPPAQLPKIKKPRARKARDFAWHCPVEDCLMEHTSKEIGGVWKIVDKQTVPIFV